MKSFIKSIFKYVFGYSLFLFVIFLLNSCDVKADMVSWQMFGFRSSDDHIKSTYYEANETNNYSSNSFVFDNTGQFFVKLTTCSTGNFKINSVSNIDGITFYNGRYTGSKCMVQGYEGYIQEYYFTAKQTVDAGNGNQGVIFGVNVSSVSYYSVTDFLGVYIADTIPQQIELPNYSSEFGEVNYRIGQVESTQQEIITKQNEIMQEQQKTTYAVNNVNDTLNNNDSTGATNEADTFFSGFETDTFGLTSIITAPLNLISSITSSSCSPLPLDIPFLSKNNKLNLPCFKSIYEKHFGSFLTIYQTITFGLVAYWVCVKIFNLVKDFKNPDHDEIEVIDL